ncbi:DUF3991 and toprim domain-containing protein [Mesorhizobium sp. SP-1A]|uniref:DUF3991 and toprim domain-containing protein n=1 Tax=Mesorhizobium sp. SP-1A TaxID=3077840 RepID=UPI0028F70C40|nr:DUF3991 and toprim domain-containing protein [Mesorhizobium sp. SP-1A]
MQRKIIEELREKVSCAAALERAGFAVDEKESTRRAVKFRRGGEIIIVTHEGKGWFDPLGDGKGDIFSLVKRLDHLGFAEGVERVAALVGFQTSAPLWRDGPARRSPALSPADRWRTRRKPWLGSATWRYLCHERFLSDAVLRIAVRQDRLREGPHSSMWAAHVDADGFVTGWEERGPEWRGFSTGGAKVLFRLGAPDGLRLCVTEAAIDAMSLASFEGLREGSLYLSTGGGWSPTTEAALRLLAMRPGAQLIAATDANTQGEAFAGRIRALAEEADCDWLRLAPPAEDWNDVLKMKRREEMERTDRGGGLPHARRQRQG